MPMPKPRHGQICGQVVYLLRRSFETNDLGHVLSNDSGVITERDPDTIVGHVLGDIQVEAEGIPPERERGLHRADDDRHVMDPAEASDHELFECGHARQ